MGVQSKGAGAHFLLQIVCIKKRTLEPCIPACSQRRGRLAKTLDLPANGCKKKRHLKYRVVCPNPFVFSSLGSDIFSKIEQNQDKNDVI